jgi:Predicted solute binding protein
MTKLIIFALIMSRTLLDSVLGFSKRVDRSGTKIPLKKNAKTSNSVQGAPATHRPLKKMILSTGLALTIIGTTTACGNTVSSVKPVHKAVVNQVQKREVSAKSESKPTKMAVTKNNGSVAKNVPRKTEKAGSPSSSKAGTVTVHQSSVSVAHFSSPAKEAKPPAHKAITKKTFVTTSKPVASQSSSATSQSTSNAISSSTKHSSSSVAGPSMSSSDLANLQNTINAINSGNMTKTGSYTNSHGVNYDGYQVNVKK